MDLVNHKDREHALLSASGANRWLNCTPSARLENQVYEEPSIFAREGTLAHEIADVLLRAELDILSNDDAHVEYTELTQHELFTPDMPGYVEAYVIYVMELLSSRVAEDLNSEAFVEARVDFSQFVPEGFGTGDAAVVSTKILDIVDLKYGIGVHVSAENNPQLRLYALGFLKHIGVKAKDVEIIRMHIVQPRLHNISVTEITMQELMHWANHTVKPIAAKAFEGEGIQKAGDWCKFCNVKARCATLASYSLKVARHEFKSPHLMSDENLATIYSQIDTISSWLESVKKYMSDKAKEGTQWPGLKLVRGQSRRFWTDEKEALRILTEEELLDIEQVTNIKIKSFTDLQKILGKKNFNEVLGPLLFKPEGAPVLVSGSDPRPGLGVESAQADFDDDFNINKN